MKLLYSKGFSSLVHCYGVTSGLRKMSELSYSLLDPLSWLAEIESEE